MPLPDPCPLCKQASNALAVEELNARVTELETELLAYKGERTLLKLEIESLRRNDPYLNRD